VSKLIHKHQVYLYEPKIDQSFEIRSLNSCSNNIQISNCYLKNTFSRLYFQLKYYFYSHFQQVHIHKSKVSFICSKMAPQISVKSKLLLFIKVSTCTYMCVYILITLLIVIRQNAEFGKNNKKCYDIDNKADD